MDNEDLKSESLNHQWSFYERAINNYSIIMRIMSSVEDDLLIDYVPKVFVEESFFDVCKIMIEENGLIHEGFYSIDETLADVDFSSISVLNSGASAPSLVNDVFGYGILYVYPIKKDLSVIGYIVLGKRYYMDIEMRLLRELEIVCDIYNKSLLLSEGGRRRPLQAKATFEIVLDELPDALLLIDKNGFICYANKQAKLEFEAKKGLLIGEKINNIVPGLHEDFTNNGTTEFNQVTYKRANTIKIFKIERFDVKERPEKGEWKGILFRDVVRKKINEEEYLLKQKMESVGMLAGGIAHDFNNMLTGILGYASLMKKFLVENAKLSRYAEAIEHSAQRASVLTQHLLNFSRRQRKSTGIIDVNALLEDVLFLLKESFREITIETDMDNALPLIKGDEAELQNVFLNLLINAKDAMDGNGTIRVRTSHSKDHHKKNFLLIELEDTGEGIDEELRMKIFEPYFSTKEKDSNLGMGLYLVDRVVREHGGFIEIESEKGKGTKFSIHIPAPSMTASKKDTKGEALDTTILNGKEIFVVDDEELVRELAKGVLASKGAIVHEARDGLEAVEIFKEKADAIHVVFLDVIMPGMKGDVVLQKMRQIRKDIRVIIASGFMNETQRAKLKEQSVDAFLDKPFTDEKIIDTVVEVLSK